METSSFVLAERYIQLKRIYSPKSWGDVAIRINEMILTPLITIFFLFCGKFDILGVASAVFNTHRTWSGFIEYSTLRMWLQRAYLVTMAIGGPFIVTNDPEYFPYVLADALTRHSSPHLHSRNELQREEGSKDTRNM